MAKSALMRVFGYRLCPNCNLYSNAGWADEQGTWFCEECQVNCIIDLFDEGFAAEEEGWTLVAGARFAARIPLIAGRFAALAAWQAGKVIVYVAGYGGGSPAVAADCGNCSGSQRAVGHRRSRWLLFGSAAAAAAASGADLKREVFESPWHVVVDGRIGHLAVGDPVEIGAFRGNIRKRRKNGRRPSRGGS